ncbi:MAG: hypothetical protein WC068_06530 [Caulobacter sp.]
MMTTVLMLAGALTFGHGPAVDQRPFAAGRADAIREAARTQTRVAPRSDASMVRYPSADGDILGGIGHGRTVQTPEPYRPMTAGLAPSASRPASRPPPPMDSTGLLGGPRH